MKNPLRKVFKKLKIKTTEDLSGLLDSVREIRPISVFKVRKSQSVNLLLPTLNSQSIYGGAATAIIFAAKLSVYLKIGLKIVQTSNKGDTGNLLNFLQQNKVDLNAEDISVSDISTRNQNNLQPLEIANDDIFVASAWGDAHIASRIVENKFIYLIQDYEPIFFQNGDRYLLSENTYHSTNFIPVCNTNLMYSFMCNKGYQAVVNKGLWFEPAVSRIESGVSTKNTGKKNLFLYGRPSVARNLFLIALQALNEIGLSGLINFDDWNLYMAGESNIPSIKLSSGHTIYNKGKMEMKEYIQFSKGIDLAISLMMSPHPNYPTLEFASIGTAVVTTSYENKQTLNNYSSNILLAQLNINSIKNAIVKAAGLTYEERMKNMQADNIERNWDTSFKRIFPELKQMLAI